MNPSSPAQAFLVGACSAGVVAAIAASLTGVADEGWMPLAGWAIAMAVPVLAVGGLSAWLAYLYGEEGAGRDRILELERQLDGPLMGRHGTVRRAPHPGEYRYPEGERPWLYVDDEDPDVELFVVDSEELEEGPVEITGARPLRPGDITFEASGVGVRVTPRSR